MYTGVSGMTISQILRGRSYGGTAILFKKSLAQYVTRINCKNKRVSGVKICMNNNFTCLLLSVYMPCNNHSNVVNQQYVEVIDCIENIFNPADFNAFIMSCVGIITPLLAEPMLKMACLSEFITRNNLHNSWTHPNSVADFTYTNFSLNHMSCIDNFIVTENVFDSIVSNNVIVDPTNPSNHNSVVLFRSLFYNECSDA